VFQLALSVAVFSSRSDGRRPLDRSVMSMPQFVSVQPRFEGLKGERKEPMNRGLGCRKFMNARMHRFCVDGNASISSFSINMEPWYEKIPLLFKANCEI